MKFFHNKRSASNYWIKEMEKIEKNLEQLANGEVDFDLTVGKDSVSTGISGSCLANINRHFTTIKGCVNTFAHNISKITNVAAEGELDTRIDISSLKGFYREVIDSINNSLDIFIQPLDEAKEILTKMAVNDYTLSMGTHHKGYYAVFAKSINDVQERLISAQNVAIKIANGDTSELENFKKIGKRSENDHLVPSFIEMMTEIRDLIDETTALSAAAIKGDLKKRGDAGKFKGGYRDVIDGMNKTLDAVMEPIEEACNIIDRIAVNDYTLTMDDKYQGIFHQLTEDVNAVHSRLISLQEVAIKVAQGDISLLDEFLKIGKRSDNDKLMPAFIGMMQSIQNLTDEVAILTGNAINGKLDAQGDTSIFSGSYKTIIEGINKVMKAIIGPIREAAAVLQEMSKGNLNIYMKGDYQGDYAIIKDALNDSIKSFNEVLHQISNASEQVAAGASQISTSGQMLSQGSEEQASSIEEITSAITQIAAQVKENAANANNANEFSRVAKENAVKGNQQMQEMLKAMEEINDSSANISKIIKVIDEIAFQTNILALNAAVEAARAGQYGKGFAVVAEEVRNLAQRSASAAKETTTMIEGSIEKAEAGTRIAKNTAQALNEIVNSVTEEAVLVEDIASASSEQATAISQVNQAIEQVSQVVQTNSATAQEGAAASQELLSQAELLKEMVEGFVLDEIKNSSDFDGTNLSPETIKLIEDIIKKKEREHTPVAKKPVHEGGMSDKKPHIVLNDHEFGKY